VETEAIITTLKNFLHKNVDIEFSLENISGLLRSRRRLQHVMLMKHHDIEVQKFFELLLTYAINAEKRTPSAGLTFLKLFLTNKKDEQKTIRTRKELEVLLRSLGHENFVSHMLLESLDLVDSNTRFSVRKSSNQKSYIEKTDGYKFSVKSLLKSKNLSLKVCRVLCVDGYIENVSEIHHLLTELSEKKVPCLFFTRGMSDDVLHTVKVNNDRKTVHVVPFSVPFDAENVNTIVDIAVSTGTDVVSSLKGELISSCKYENLGRCEEAIIDGGNVVIKNAKISNRVDLHISSLKEQLESKKGLEEILSKRLQSLSSSCVDVYIPDDFSYFHRSSQFDEGIRIISSVLNNTFSPEKVARDTLESFEKFVSSVALFTVS